ncbi:ABC transporter permease [Acidisoma cellulosilytica]|uniref:ABC transporter permease n=1 Tax=Acidisoma cellulosilyticum TaxID=2802395 RepID=A0A964E744_9PROT|nr:ABC transporter permease [Acidisoma cellulosilyticum]MCB8883623.1 ABC transporter permease [Acidisoma cellulosilyticum]
MSSANSARVSPTRPGWVQAGLANRGTWLPILVVVGLIVVFAVTSPPFLSWRNFSAITGEGATLLIASLGASFVILMGSIDLSVGSIVLLVGSVCVTLLADHDYGLMILPLAALLGLVLGGINGMISVVGRVPSFVVTLGSLSVFTGIALSILSGQAIMFDSTALDDLATGHLIPHLPNIALCALALWVIAVAIGIWTKFGRFILIIGGGEIVARTSGLPVGRYKILSFAFSGMMAGIASVFAMSRLGAVGPTLGQDLLLNTIAAIVVGGTSLAGGAGGVHRTFVGVAIIALLNNGLNLLGVGPYWQMVIKGAVVIGAVLVGQDRLLTRIVK